MSKKSPIGWEHLADWYNGWVGPNGSKYHQTIAIPGTIKLLNIKKGEEILDLGCGTASISESVLNGGSSYTGVDISPKMISYAKQRHPRGNYILADIESPRMKMPIKYDAAIFILSIQDMSDISQALRNAVVNLKPHGRVVLWMTHPAFRIPRQSGWGYDAQRKINYRRIDSYLRELSVPLNSRTGRKTSVSYHRPLSSYIDAMTEVGLVITKIVEPVVEGLGNKNKDIPVFIGIRGELAN